MAYQKSEKKVFRERKSRPFAQQAKGPLAKSKTRIDVTFRDRVQAPTFVERVGFKKVAVGWKAVSSLRKPCALSARAGSWRRGKTELMWVGNEAAKLFERKTGKKLEPGPTLRLCAQPNQPSVIVPVREPLRAAELARDHRACVLKGKRSPKACAALASNLPGASFGRAPKLSLMDRLRR